MWALPTPAASLIVSRFPLLTAHFFQRNDSSGYTRVPAYSVMYSVEYSNSKLIDSAALFTDTLRIGLESLLRLLVVIEGTSEMERPRGIILHLPYIRGVRG